MGTGCGGRQKCQGKTKKQKFLWHVDSVVQGPVQLEERVETKQCPLTEA